MKKILSAFIAAVMIFCGMSSVFADDPAPPAADGGLAVKEGAMLKIDGGRLVLMDGAITVAELNDGLTSPANVVSHSGDAKSDDDPVASGDVVTAGGSSAEVLFYGDVDRDGTVSVSDVILTLKQIAGHEVDIDNTAADVDADGSVNSSDAVKMMKYTADWEVSLGNLRMTAENVTVTAPAEDSDIDLYFAPTMTKIGRSDTISTGMYTYKMKLAKNEYESTQIVLLAKKDYEGLKVEISDFEYEFGGHTDAISVELRDSYYYDISTFWNLLEWPDYFYTSDYYADPLPPMPESIELTADCTKVIMLTISSSKDAPAGMYRASVNIKNAAGDVIKTAYVYAYVWDFTLPDTPYSASAFGMTAFKTEQYKDYYDDLLEYRVSAYKLPYEISSSAADAYLNDPRVTSYCIHGEGYGGVLSESEDEIRRSIVKLHTNPDWERRGYFYTVDEPYSDWQFDKIESDWNYLNGLYKEELGKDAVYDINTCVPLANNFTIDQLTGQDKIDRMKDFVTLWCPQSLAFTERNEHSPNNYSYTQPRSYALYGDTIKRLQDLKYVDGKDLWWYICNSPQMPYANYFTNYTGNRIRMVAWQQFLFDIDGILYWAVSYWDGVSKYHGGGEGCLIYWEELFGFDGGLVPTYRLINVRDSFDDFDYLRMAEEVCGREAVCNVVKEHVTTRIMDYSEDYHDIEIARDIIAQMIVDAKA